MIAALSGRVTHRDEKTVTLDVHGVGFRLFAIPRTIEQASPGTTVTLLTHLHVREDALELFGFSTAGEQRLFEKLLSVSGVGPKMALSVLSAAPVGDLEQAIERGQSDILTNVSGVGKKTAERIIVDLRGKLDLTAAGDDSTLSTVIDALVQLGYSPKEARAAAAATPATLPASERVKAALQQLGK